MFLPGESQGRRSLVGCSLWGRTESDTTEVTLVVAVAVIDPDKMVFQDSSPPSSRMLGFQNKVTIPCSTPCPPTIGLSFGKQTQLGLGNTLTGTKAKHHSETYAQMDASVMRSG